MIPNQKVISDMKNLIADNSCDDFWKNTALYYIKKLQETISADDDSLRAIVGYDENDIPVYWDLSQGNMLAAAPTGIGMNYAGSTAIIASLLMKTSERQLQYYIISDEPTATFIVENKQCLGYANWWMESAEPALYNVMDSIRSELERRKKLTKDELTVEPFILVVLGNALYFWYDTPDSIVWKEFVFDLLQNGKSLRMTTLVTSTRLFAEYDIYGLCRETFSCYLIGSSGANGLLTKHLALCQLNSKLEEKWNHVNIEEYFVLNEQSERESHGGWCRYNFCIFHDNQIGKVVQSHHMSLYIALTPR